MTGATSAGRNVKDAFVGQLTQQVVRLVSNLVLARLLGPEAFGVVAVAIIMGAVLDEIKDIGTGAVVVQRQEIDDTLLNTVFSVNVVLSAVMFAAVWLSAEPLAAVLGNPDASPVLQAYAGITVISAVGQIHQALLRRELRYRAVSIATSASAWATFLTSVPLAYLGLGAWSLVIGNAAGAAVGALAVWAMSSWRPSGLGRLSVFLEVLPFSVHVFCSNLATVAFNQADRVIVSRITDGSTSLGAYTLANRLLTSPVSALGSAVADVALPLFSGAQADGARLRQVLMRATSAVSMLVLPVMALVVGVTSTGVATVLGEAWAPLVPIVYALAPGIALQTTTRHIFRVLIATGRTPLLNVWTFASLAGLLAFELAGAHWGFLGVAIGYSVGSFVLLPIGVAVVLRAVEQPIAQFFLGVAPYWLLSVAAGVVTWFTGPLLHGWGVPAVLEVILACVAGGLAYVALLLVFRRDEVDGFLGTLKARRR